MMYSFWSPPAIAHILFDVLLPGRANGRGAFPHVKDCFSNDVIVQLLAAVIVLEGDGSVRADAEVGGGLHGVDVGPEEQKLPAVLLLFLLHHGLHLVAAVAAAGVLHVLRNTGITATAGIGTNLYLAKVAMDIVAKKAPPDQDGVRIAELDEMSYRMLLWCHQPLTAFWQIGPGKTRRLAKYGIHTMGDIAQMSIADEEFLYRLFGIDAEILIDHAWGKEPCTLADIKNYRPKANSRSVGQVLSRPYRFDEARLVYSEMIDQLALDLVTRGVKTKELSFWVSFDPALLEELPSYDGPVSLDYYGRLHPGHVVGSVRLRTHTSSTREILDALLYAFDKKVDHRLLIRRLGIVAGNLQEGGEQLDFFTDYAAREREARLQRTLLEVRRKYSAPKALIKGKNMLEGATAIERSQQIGGHKMYF